MKSILLILLILPAVILAQVKKDKDTLKEAVGMEIDMGGIVLEGKVKKGDKIRLKDINFVEGSVMLLPTSYKALRNLLIFMQENENIIIQIQGHICCDRYDPDDLSTARARVIYFYLADNGIKWSRISYKGFGGSQPIFPIPESNSGQQRANRRVEIEIIDN